MKKFITPELSVCRFDAQDIITDSGVTAADIVKTQLGSTDELKTVAWNEMSIMD